MLLCLAWWAGATTAASLSAEDALNDLALARDALEGIHPGYDRYTSREVLDAAWSRAEERVRAAATITDVHLYRELAQVLTAIRCDHTLAELPPAFERARREIATFFPLQLRLFEGRAYVIALDGESAGALRPGDEVVAIDGRPMADVVRQILPLLAVDGRTEYVRPSTFASSGDLLASGFEHFYPVLFGEWWRAGASTITVRRIEGDATREFSSSVRPITFDRWQAIGDQGPYRQNFVDAVHSEIRDNGVATLRIDTFVNYRAPVDPDEVYGPLFAEYAARRVHTLVLDTRRNGGGSDDAMLALLAWLSSEPFTLLRERRVRTIDLSPWAEHLDTWDPSALTPDPARFERVDDGDGWRVLPTSEEVMLSPQAPKPGAFTGRLLVLSSARNASAMTMLLAKLRARPATAVVGEATGGSATGPTAGVIYFLRLPASGIRVRIPWQRHWVDVGDAREGVGIVPEIEVVTTLEDVLSGRDPAFERAINLARLRPRMRWQGQP